MALESINPTNGELISTFSSLDPDQVDRILQSVSSTFQEWQETRFEERKQLMHRASEVLLQNREGYAELMATEMGKPIAAGRAEVQKCAWVCEYYAEHADRFLKDEMIETDASRSYVTFRPLGVVLAIMPWNFPFWQVFRFAAPGLMAGNAAVLKHASNVQGCALAIEGVFQKAGFPEDLFRTLLLESRQVDAVIEHPLIQAVTLTGSVPAGQAVSRKAGEVLKKTVLELGGSDPYLILEDADLEKAAHTCVSSRLINSGQSCIAAKRFIVVEAVLEEFQQRFVQEMKSRKMGDPFLDDTEVGPQARVDLRDDLHRQVTQSIEQGADCLLGGEMPEGKGAFYPPTVLTNVEKGMPAFDEETFGPVAAIIGAEHEADAVRLANDSPFGLGAAVFTEDRERGERIAAQFLQAGSCFVNSYVKSDPRLPFGGIKESGYGRELSHYGIKEFVNIKTVYVD
jgi:succinate-semialdehyde dehydrogenase/glutarate-semialdehyde dehydrogenase